MKIKKITSIIMAGVLSLGLVACGSGSNGGSTSAKKDEKKVVIWAWDATFNVQAAKEAKEIFLKKHPDVDVQIVEMSQDDIVQKLNTNLSANTTTGLPNVVLIEDYRSQNFLSSYTDQFKDLSSKVDKSKFMDYKVTSTSFNGKQYGVPFDSGATALFYRKDLIQKAGYTDQDMQNLTWDKYVEIGKAVKAKTGVNMVTEDPSDLGILRVMMQSAKSWYVKPDGKTINIKGNEALKKALTIYKQMHDAGITEQESGWDQYIACIQGGKCATVPQGCWISSSIVKAENMKGQWAMAQTPKLEGINGATNFSNSGGSSWYVLDKIGNSDLAADFLAETFGSSTELMNSLQKDINLISTLKDAKTTKNCAVPVDFYGGQAIGKDLAEYTEKIPAVNYGLNTYAVEDVLKSAVQDYIKGSKTIDQALESAQSEAESTTTASN